MTWRHWMVVALIGVWVSALGAACQAPPPEVSIARIPPDYMAAKRKSVGNLLLTGVLVYQQFRPMVVCPDPNCVSELQRADEDLQKIFSSFWDALFVWPVAPAGSLNDVDWAQTFKDLLALVIKISKYIPVRAAVPPSLQPPPSVPRLLPQVPGNYSQPPRSDDIVDIMGKLPVPIAREFQRFADAVSRER